MSLAASEPDRDFPFELPASSDGAHTLTLRAAEGGRVQVAEVALNPRVPPRCLE